MCVQRAMYTISTMWVEEKNHEHSDMVKYEVLDSVLLYSSKVSANTMVIP